MGGGYTFSSDSKSPVTSNYFLKIKEEKLRKIFPYLNSFINSKKSINNTDIRKVNKIPSNIDIFTYSFPCQDLSQQGKGEGFYKNSRSSLLFEVKRILNQNKNNLPKVLLMENVKALSQKKFSPEFKEWINSLAKLGYKSTYKIINSRNHGSAQNRERLFMVSFLKENNFNWPQKRKKSKKIANILEIKNNQFEFKKYSFLLDKNISKFHETKNGITKALIGQYTNFNSENYLYHYKSKYGPTLTASGANSRLKFYFEKEKKIRHLTALEAYKYMGFSKSDAEKVIKTKILSESKMIYTCGNSISVEVLEDIFTEIIKALQKG